MSSKIEEVARALREAVRNGPEVSVSFEEMSFILARAAIEAMREPADHIAGLLFPGCEVLPARRVHSLYSTSGTTLSSRAELIIDRSAA